MQLEQAGWLPLVGSVIVATDGPTCGERIIDYFVVPHLLRPHVVAVQRLEGAGTSPHTPIRLLVQGDCRSGAVRVDAGAGGEYDFGGGEGELEPEQSRVSLGDAVVEVRRRTATRARSPAARGAQTSGASPYLQLEFM